MAQPSKPSAQSQAASAPQRAQSAIAASRQAATNAPVACADCAAKAELQAVILFPALGTPLIAPSTEKRIRLFLIAEEKCLQLFGATGKEAPYAWYYINQHLRILPFQEATKTRADLKGTKLYASDEAARNGIRIWYQGAHGAGWQDKLIGHQGRIVANLRQTSVTLFVDGKLSDGSTLQPAFASSADADTNNHSLRHLFEIELDFAGLSLMPAPDTMYTLAWMVTCVYQKEPQAFGEKVTHWEHQDKLVYDFFRQMHRDKKHFAQPFAFDLSKLKADAWPSQLSGELHRIKPYHPLIFRSDRPRLDIGHLSDIHVSSRQFALARADAAVLEGISPRLGSRVTNCLTGTKELFDAFSAGADRVDTLFITGDLLDFNRNLDPSKVEGKAPKDQWAFYNLAANVDNADLYPRGLDDMLMYSLVKRSYVNGLPVFMTSGNHEAYEEPYGISPRVNSYAAKRAADPRSDAYVTNSLRAAQRHQPTKNQRDYDPNDTGPTELNWAPDFSPAKANPGVPADHNLTIYEACLVYGPTFPQILQSWNHVPNNYDWFFTLFTPLADFAVSYNDQLLIGLEWGDGERMLEGTFLPSGVLPRAVEPITNRQKALLKNALAHGSKQNLLFSHFTYVNYGQKRAFATASEWNAVDLDDTLVSGTFEQNRAWVYRQLGDGKISAAFSGHSHRSGGYSIEIRQSPMRIGIAAHAHAPEKHAHNPKAQVWVSSCAGGIGIQNLCGELDGWNLMPPSGSRFDAATGRVRTVAVRRTKGARPRFCVALDYLQCHEGRRVLEWSYSSGGAIGRPSLTMTVTNILHAVPFIREVTFYVWDSDIEKFILYSAIPSAIGNLNGRAMLRFALPLSNLDAFARAIGIPGGQTPMAFVKVDFNRNLATVTERDTGAKLYDQYNFDDPWIFRVDASKDGSIFNHPKGEIPDWAWLEQTYQDRYPIANNVLAMRRPSAR